MDGSKKAFAFLDSDTIAKVVEAVSEKLELKVPDHFSLLEVRKDDERWLKHDETIGSVKTSWGDRDDVKLIFKRKLFFPSNDSGITDPAAVNLLFIQAVYDVIQGNYPCSEDDALNLGGLQLQVTFGDWKASYEAGFLKDKISTYVPKALVASKTLEEWENVLVSKWKPNVGKSALDAKGLYLNEARNWHFYGSALFHVLRFRDAKKVLQEKAWVGVNHRGLLLLADGSKEFIAQYNFNQIGRWANSTTSFTFVVGDSTSEQKFAFESTQSMEVSSMLQSYVDVLLAEYRARQAANQKV